MTKKSKSILVNDAAGFIGAKTAEFLLKSGYKVIGMRNLVNPAGLTRL